MSQAYAYDPEFAEERARLAGMESLWDPGSRALLSELGLKSGARCLEIGGGGGTMVEWMAEQVGREGRVLVTDIDTRFLAGLASDIVEVQVHDVRTDHLPDAEFDLIHSRLVLEHLPERNEILRRLVGALRPGGWIVIEDYDWTAFGFEGGDEVLDRAADAVMTFMGRSGFVGDYGRQIVSQMAGCGLGEVRGEARARIIDSDSPGFDFFRLSFESLREGTVAAGLLSRADAEAASAGFAGTELRVFTPMMVAGIGRAPE